MTASRAAADSPNLEEEFRSRRVRQEDQEGSFSNKERVSGVRTKEPQCSLKGNEITMRLFSCHWFFTTPPPLPRSSSNAMRNYVEMAIHIGSSLLSSFLPFHGKFFIAQSFVPATDRPLAAMILNMAAANEIQKSAICRRAAGAASTAWL